MMPFSPARRTPRRSLRSIGGSAATLWCAALSACADKPVGPDVPAGCAAARSLSRGQVQQIAGGASLNCIVVAAASEASEYVLITANAASTQDDVLTYRVMGEAGTGALTSRLEIAAPRSSIAPLADETDTPLALSARAESARRAATRRRLAGYDVGALASAVRTRVPTAAARAAVAIGDTLTYRVGDALSADMCTTFSNVRAVVRAISTRALVVQDVAAPPAGFSAADFAAIAAEYDAVVHPTDVKWFGEPTDINSDGRVVLFFTPAINRLTPRGSLGYVGGYFWSPDLLPRTVAAQGYTCPASNEQEIMYLLTPDPTGQVNGNIFTVSTVFRAMRGTVAHELQHLINQGIRQGRGVASEADWLNEGMSHLAEELVGRAVRSFPVTRALDYDDVLTDLDDYEAFFKQNLIRYRAWMARPDLASPISQKAISELAPRGASWALLRYALDQYAGATPETFTRALVVGPQRDVANLEARARVSFAEILPGFLIAAIGDTTNPALASRYRFTSWSMRDAMTGFNGGVFPLRMTAMPTQLTTQSSSGSGNYFVLTRPAGSSPFTFRMQAADGTPATADGARAYLMRLR